MWLRGVVLGGVGMLAFGGCGSVIGADAGRSTGSAAYLFQRISAPDGAVSLYPPTLEQNLPNHTSLIDTGERQVSTTVTKVLVVGKVTEVRHGDAIIYKDGDLVNEEPVPTRTDWEDAGVAYRDLIVTVSPKNTVGADVAEKDGPISFRLTIVPGSDPDKYEAAVRNLGTVVLLLSDSPAPQHKGEYVPARGLSGIGVVDDSGRLSFPGMGEGQETFMAGIDTVQELVAAASQPPVTDKIDSSQLRS